MFKVKIFIHSFCLLVSIGLSIGLVEVIASELEVREREGAEGF